MNFYISILLLPLLFLGIDANCGFSEISWGVSNYRNVMSVDGVWEEEFPCFSIGVDGPKRDGGELIFDGSDRQLMMCDINMPLNLNPNQFIEVELAVKDCKPSRRAVIFDVMISSAGLTIPIDEIPSNFGVAVDDSMEQVIFNLDLWNKHGFYGDTSLLIVRDVNHHSDLAESVIVESSVIIRGSTI